MTKPLRIYSAVWGKYLDWFEKGTVQSFKWPRNNQALLNGDVTWSILTKKEDAERAFNIIRGAGVEKVEVLLIPEGASPDHSYNRAMVWGFVSEVTRSLDLNSGLLIAPPDLIFGDGTLENLLLLGNIEPNVCVCLPHVRANECFFEHMGTGPLSNADLVDIAFRRNNLHESWRAAEFGSENSTSFQGGISWHRLPAFMQSRYRVTHHLPAPFYMNFIPSDISYWMKQEWFGAIDHEWPSIFYQQNRGRVITHSSLGFIVEITQNGKNVPEYFPGNRHDPCGFVRTQFHNSVNKAMVCIFEGNHDDISTDLGTSGA